jgi:hypothetical protein
MAKYELMVDGQRRGKVTSDDEVRQWLVRYREEHAEDDPDATHVQVMQLTSWSWLAGGKLVDRALFLGDDA